MIAFIKKIVNSVFIKKTAFNKYLYQILGFYPENLVFYDQAFKHKSLHKENNERLEFLGDAILDAIISKELYFRFPEKKEGALSKLRSKIVNRSFLNNLGKILELEKYLDFQLNSISLDDTNIRGNTFEALIGAIYLDGGIDLVHSFLKKKIFKKYIDWNKIDKQVIDFKSKLIQYSQKTGVALSFVLVNEEKTDANTTQFIVLVKLNNKNITTAKGTSKKKAEQNASKKALEIII